MNYSEIKLYLITDEKQRFYFTGFASSAGDVLLMRGRKVFVVDSRYYYAAAQQLKPKGIKVVCGTGYDVLKEYVAKSDAEVVGIDFSKTTIKEFDELKALGLELVDAQEDIQKQMSIKSAKELENIAAACAIAEKSFRETVKELKSGISENEVAALLEYRFRMNGASDKSFNTIVAFGENSAVPHHETGDARLKKNMPVLMDFGCLYNGYCSDMTRTFYYGIPPREFVRAYDAVYRAHIAAFENIRAGQSGVRADSFARELLSDEGYGDYFTHSLGHGIGVNIHEYPVLSPKGRNLLKDGMVFSIEPGVYIEGKFGIRIEDTVVMKGGQPQTFMKEPKELCVWVDGKLKKYK